MPELGSYNPNTIAKEAPIVPKINMDYSNLKPQVQNNFQNVVSKAREVTLDLSQFLEDEPIKAPIASVSPIQAENSLDNNPQLNNYK